MLCDTCVCIPELLKYVAFLLLFKQFYLQYLESCIIYIHIYLLATVFFCSLLQLSYRRGSNWHQNVNYSAHKLVCFHARVMKQNRDPSDEHPQCSDKPSAAFPFYLLYLFGGVCQKLSVFQSRDQSVQIQIKLKGVSLTNTQLCFLCLYSHTCCATSVIGKASTRPQSTHTGAFTYVTWFSLIPAYEVTCHVMFRQRFCVCVLLLYLSICWRPLKLQGRRSLVTGGCQGVTDRSRGSRPFSREPTLSPWLLHLQNCR